MTVFAPEELDAFQKQYAWNEAGQYFIQKHASLPSGCMLENGRWFPCSWFDNGDIESCDVNFDTALEAANYARNYFT